MKKRRGLLLILFLIIYLSLFLFVTIGFTGCEKGKDIGLWDRPSWAQDSVTTTTVDEISIYET